ncbi:hypothetical protein EG856_02010 [Mycoplasmopsis phocirhinis]|uniref:Haloacid dehalogenase n=1 Tax=Mycoplasmopsis phocirhinis TaxID=142650 RepID=A0A4P6MRK5_9BACT|nr:HAD hydrolase family protein [Mycoplasmopsis phocirhinis]QBF34689.1 hypothetical protein EG856_02010 [Mycoplasmopsis phocirhinis]
MEKIFKRIAFCDIKNTFFDLSNNEFNTQTRQSILEYTKQGLLFVISTSSPIYNLDANQNLILLANQLNSRYIIASNGAEIFDAREEKYLKTTCIDELIIQKIIDFSKEFNVKIERSYIKQYYIDKDEETKNNDCRKNITSLISILCSFDNCKQIYQKLLNLNLPIEMVISEKTILITQKNVSIHNSISYLIDILNTDVKNAMAIAYNDNDLIAYSKIAYLYALDDATIPVKNKVTLFSSASNQNGIGEAIIDYFYRTRMMAEMAEQYRIKNIKLTKEIKKQTRSNINRKY